MAILLIQEPVPPLVPSIVQFYRVRVLPDPFTKHASGTAAFVAKVTFSSWNESEIGVFLTAELLTEQLDAVPGKVV